MDEGISLGEFYSWFVADDTVAAKVMDKSAMTVGESGIPMEVRPFFSLGSERENRRIELYFRHKTYSGRLYVSPVNRAKISWPAKLRDLFSDEYSYEEAEAEGNYPCLMFERIHADAYTIDILPFYDREAVRTKNRIEGASGIDETDTAEPPPGSVEGSAQYRLRKVYERNPANRAKAIEAHGTRCMACDFDFEEFYGERGRHYIQVHHARPLHASGPVKVDPVKDLVCLCSNCHSIVHNRRSHELTMDELKEIVHENGKWPEHV